MMPESFAVCLVVDRETGMGCVRRVSVQVGMKSCQKRSPVRTYADWLWCPVCGVVWVRGIASVGGVCTHVGITCLGKCCICAALA